MIILDISRLIKVTASVFIILALLTGISIYYFNTGIENERNAVSRQAEMRDLASELIAVTEYKTEQVKAYIQFGLDVSYNNYIKEVNENKTEEKVLNRIKELNVSKESMNYLENAIAVSKNLTNTELKALEAYQNNDRETAEFLITNSGYEASKSKMMEYLELFERNINEEAKVYTADIMVRTDFLYKKLLYLQHYW